MVIRTRIDRIRRLARRLTLPRLKDGVVPRYSWTMIDLFSVPAGTVPQVDPEHGVDQSTSFPAEIDDYLGKWVAVRRDDIIAVRDTEEDLLETLGEDQLGVTLFHVPSSVVAAR
jgi:Family of unknown function (DUF5678)